MNNLFKANLLKTLTNGKKNQGFTLIELLVVVIIIGVLAAIALPNLLGQVGKARESEAKSTLGAMTRAQQTVFAERGSFARSMAEMEVPVGNEKYYAIFLDQAANSPANIPQKGWMGAVGVNRNDAGEVTDIGAVANGQNGTRDYAAGITYDPLNRVFSTVICRASNAKKNDKYALHGTPTAAGKTVNASVSGLNGNTGHTTTNNAVSSCDTTITDEVN